MSVKNKLAPVAFALAALSFAHSASALEYSLKGGRWQMIAVPAYLPEGMNTPMTVFGDEILAIDSSAEYGEGDDKDWVMYSYNSENNTYDLLGADDPIQTDKGYWIIQLIANEITVSLPEQSVLADGSHADMLAAELGCAPGQLIRGAESQAWECVDFPTPTCPADFVSLYTGWRTEFLDSGRGLSEELEQYVESRPSYPDSAAKVCRSSRSIGEPIQDVDYRNWSVRVVRVPDGDTVSADLYNAGVYASLVTSDQGEVLEGESVFRISRTIAEGEITPDEIQACAVLMGCERIPDFSSSQ